MLLEFEHNLHGFWWLCVDITPCCSWLPNHTTLFWASVQMTRFSPPPHSHLFSCMFSLFLSLTNLPHILYIMHPSKYIFNRDDMRRPFTKYYFLWLNDILFSINTYFYMNWWHHLLRSIRINDEHQYIHHSSNSSNPKESVIKIYKYLELLGKHNKL